jgi:DNA-binding beta-propeller fold protein YncE
MASKKPTQVIKLTATEHLTEYQNRATFHNTKKLLYDTHGEVTELGIWNPSTGLDPTKYLIYRSGSTVYVVDEFGTPTTFSALESLSGERSGTILRAYNKLIQSGRIF